MIWKQAQASAQPCSEWSQSGVVGVDKLGKIQAEMHKDVISAGVVLIDRGAIDNNSLK